MLQTYCLFVAGGNQSVAETQPLVNGVPVNMIRADDILNLSGNQQFYTMVLFNRNVTITVNNALTGRGTITINGWNSLTGLTTETISTIGSGTTTSVNTYNKIDSVVFTLLPGQILPPPPALPTTISLGLSTTGVAYVPISTMEYMQQVSIAANIISGTMTYAVAQTIDNIIYPANSYLDQFNGTQFWEAIPSMAASASKIATPSEIKIPIGGFRITVSASTGSAIFTILQQGGAFR